MINTFDEIQKRCGLICKEYRINILKMTQFDIAKQIGYSKENISSFENGRNDNNTIFLWYVANGLLKYCSIEDICGCFIIGDYTDKINNYFIEKSEENEI